MQKIRALFVMFQFILTIAIVVLLMYAFKKFNRQIRQKWAKLQRSLIGYKMQIKGEIDPDAKLLIVNHQSVVDIVVLEDLHPKNLCWIAKKEIENLPFFGHVIKTPEMISVEREDKKSLIKLLKDTKDRVSKGRVIAIFPEGTRGDGKQMLKFKNGAKLLATKLSLKAQPVVICGSKDVLDSQNLLANSGTVKINFLPPVNLEQEEWYEKMQQNMQKVLDELANDTSHR